MNTKKIRMHPDQDVDVERPSDLLLTDPEPFTVIAVRRVGSSQDLTPNQGDYPFVDDDATTKLLGDAADVGGDGSPERFQKRTPQLRGQPKDGFNDKKYKIEWRGSPQTRGPHFRVFP